MLITTYGKCDFAACNDLDLNFSPSTNLLPIRRLNLDIGDEMQVRAAWLRFPSFGLEPLTQPYRRIDEKTYRYESHGGDFGTELSVNGAGFVTRYPDLWEIEDGRDNAQNSTRILLLSSRYGPNILPIFPKVPVVLKT